VATDEIAAMRDKWNGLWCEVILWRERSGEMKPGG
jgi:hypothetical protein